MDRKTTDVPPIQSGAERRTPNYWPHAPSHRLCAGGTFIVTAGTFRKQHFFAGNAQLNHLQLGLLKYSQVHKWRLEAWAVFPNHYHFVAHSPEGTSNGAASLSVFLAEFHQRSTAWLNAINGTRGRKIWHNFWETRLTYERSYLARLNYVHQNPVRHGLVQQANQYRWCSASWFEAHASRSMVRTVYGFKTDTLRIYDDF